MLRKIPSIGYLIIAFLLIYAVSAFGQITGMGTNDKMPLSPRYPTAMVCEHVPLIYSGTIDTLLNTSDTTVWMQLGYSIDAITSADGQKSNRSISNYNPEFFTYVLKADTFSTGSSGDCDSLGIKSVTFELAHDTTATPIHSYDDSHKFILDGNAGHVDYNVWVYEDVPNNVYASSALAGKALACPLAVSFGGYIRFILTTDCPDTMTVNWELIVEH